MRHARLVCWLATAALVLAACARDASPPAVPPADPPVAPPPTAAASRPAVPAILRSWTEMEGPFVPRSCALVEDDDTWKAVWARVGRDTAQLPEVDFESECVVAVFHGLVRAIEGMDATIETEGEAATLVYNVRGTSGVLSPEVHPWGFYVVSHTTQPIRVVCHERAGPGPAEVTELATLRAKD